MPAEQVRRDRLRALVDLTDGVGLEIGPLDRAFALRDECDVRYVDVRDTASMREHYRIDPAIDCDAIPDMDFTLYGSDGNIRSLAEATKRDAPYRWVFASHVIEHVPDLIGWLSDVAEILDDDGVLALVIPDRRFTFDALRPQTTVGQILQAHESGDTIPSIRAVYDYFSTVVRTPAPELWAGLRPDDQARLYTVQEAAAHLERARSDHEYVDCHVWMFTPASFVAQLRELGELGLCDFKIKELLTTQPGEIEFFTTLQRIPRGLDPEQARSWRETAVAAATDIAPDITPDSTPVREEKQATALVPSARELRLLQAKRKALGLARRGVRRMRATAGRR